MTFQEQIELAEAIIFGILIKIISQIRYGKQNQFTCDGLFNYETISPERTNQSLGLFSNCFVIKNAFTHDEWKDEFEYLTSLQENTSFSKEQCKEYYGLNC
jgi:hypothetical protein